MVRFLTLPEGCTQRVKAQTCRGNSRREFFSVVYTKTARAVGMFHRPKPSLSWQSPRRIHASRDQRGRMSNPTPFDLSMVVMAVLQILESPPNRVTSHASTEDVIGNTVFGIIKICRAARAFTPAPDLLNRRKECKINAEVWRRLAVPNAMISTSFSPELSCIGMARTIAFSRRALLD